jgi:AI-2 transport protein TqsA
VLFWGFVWGPVGMFLAVPLTMVLKVMLDNSDELRWIAVAITKEKRIHPMLIPKDEEVVDRQNSMSDDKADLSGAVPESRS